MGSHEWDPKHCIMVQGPTPALIIINLIATKLGAIWTPSIVLLEQAGKA